ncbi:MAG TPA: hypothetical protein VFT55_14630 [Planctomycetota bacterium]|nr:hypothetical protein [Planctomycetota bacterium]
MTLAFRVARALWWLWMAAMCCLAAVAVWLDFVAPEAAGASDPPRTLGEKVTMLGILAAMFGLGLLFRVLLRKAEVRMVALAAATADEDRTERPGRA